MQKATRQATSRPATISKHQQAEDQSLQSTAGHQQHEEEGIQLLYFSKENSATIAVYFLAIPMNSIAEATEQGGRRPSHTGFRLTP